MSQSITTSPSPEAAAPAVDPTECPGRPCPARYAHAHCSGCGDVINFEDGGRELDGTQYHELPDDAEFCSCGEPKHRDCQCALDKPSLTVAQQIAREANGLRPQSEFTVTTNEF